jgi:hypothetical protein
MSPALRLIAALCAVAAGAAAVAIALHLLQATVG